MRTTLTLEDEAAEIARMYAASRSLTLSKAVSELLLQAAKPTMRIDYADGFPVFDIPQDTTITNEQVRAALDNDQ